MAQLPISVALSAHDPHLAARVWSAIGPAAHRLAPSVRHAALPLCEVDAVVDTLPVSALPAQARTMARRRLRAFVAGRLCAEHALLQIGIEPQALTSRAIGGPCWPADVVGSIAHTDFVAFAAVAGVDTTAGLGIDSEPRIDERGLADVRSACCTPAERDCLFGTDDDRLTATVVFSAKEAYYKAISPRVGRIVEFLEVEVRQVDLLAGTVQLVPVSMTLKGHAAYAEATVCVANDVVHTAVALPPPER